LDALRELCDHPKSRRLQESLRSPANSAAKVDLPSGEATITERTELKQVEERLAIGANVVYDTIRRQGEEELRRTASALAWSAFAAGCSS
jgi:formate-nitrite transporter family protein